MNPWEVATAMLRRPMSVAPGAEPGAIACERALVALLGEASDERPASVGTRTFPSTKSARLSCL
jgi:hypothetical protein